VKERCRRGRHCGRAQVLTIMSKYNRGKWGQYMVRLEPGGAVFFHREVAPWGLKTAEALAPGAWHHIAAVYKDGWSSVYVNGTVWATQKEGAQVGRPFSRRSVLRPRPQMHTAAVAAKSC